MSSYCLTPPSSFSASSGNLESVSEDELSTAEYVEKSITLQWLADKELELRTAIIYEKLRRKEPVILDRNLLIEKISQQKQMLQKQKNAYEAKKNMALNLQFADVLQKITSSSTRETNKYTESQRNCIVSLWRKKEELSTKIRLQQQEIICIENDILKMQDYLSVNTQFNSSEHRVKADFSENKSEEVKRLMDHNRNLRQRILWLSRAIQSLICKCQLSDKELLDLKNACSSICDEKLIDIEDIESILDEVCSVNL